MLHLQKLQRQLRNAQDYCSSLADSTAFLSRSMPAPKTPRTLTKNAVVEMNASMASDANAHAEAMGPPAPRTPKFVPVR